VLEENASVSSVNRNVQDEPVVVRDDGASSSKGSSRNAQQGQPNVGKLVVDVEEKGSSTQACVEGRIRRRI
jgi:hypothetical protein